MFTSLQKKKKHFHKSASVVAIKKGAFGSPSTTVANFTYSGDTIIFK